MFGRFTPALFLIWYSFCRPSATTCSPPKPEHSTYWSCAASITLLKVYKNFLLIMCIPLIILISVYIFSNVNFLHMYYIKKWIILRYSWNTENGTPSSHIHVGIRLLNSWWGPPWMWEKGELFHHIPGLPKNFPKKIILNILL